MTPDQNIFFMIFKSAFSTGRSDNMKVETSHEKNFFKMDNILNQQKNFKIEKEHSESRKIFENFLKNCEKNYISRCKTVFEMIAKSIFPKERRIYL